MKSEILLATSNSGKIREMKSLLGSQFICRVPSEFKAKAPDVEEDGTTYSANAEKKARAFYAVYQIPVLSDDSGLEVDALSGAPGVISARYGGEKISWPERWAYLHRALAPHPVSQWTACFRCVLCYFTGTEPPRFFEGVCEGRILEKPLGAEGFGYDPLFYSTDLQKGFGVATESEKAKVSHRARACAEFQKKK